MLLISFVVKIRDGGSFYIFDFDDGEDQNTVESYEPTQLRDSKALANDYIKKQREQEKEYEILEERINELQEDLKNPSKLEPFEFEYDTIDIQHFELPPFVGKSISFPKSGYSPYNSYFGKGIYNNSADNYIKVTAPISYHIVFLLKDVYSKRTIRNEFIRKGSTFDLTGIPYGTYEFSYFSGDDWSDEQEMKNGEIKGGFTKNKSFSKSEQYKDRMEFRSDQYGGYEIKLISTVSGNLSTQTSNEDEFFN